MRSESMLRLASQALANGGEQITRKRVEWDIAGNCQAPKGRDITLPAVGEHKRLLNWQSQAAYKRQSGVAYTIKPPRDRTLPLGFVVGLTVRCRKCPKCRRMRQMLWSDRAKNEISSSFRTWFGTLTMRPEAQFHFLAKARQRENDQGIDFDMLDYGEQFRLRVQAVSPEITNYIKRVREQSAAPLRYLWVCEAHKSGSPHFHCLMHETSDLRVSYRCLADQWSLGFTQWKLVENLSAGLYLTKYLSKTTAARVRASVGYGNTSLDLAQLMDIGRDLQMSNADQRQNPLSSEGLGGRKSPSLRESGLIVSNEEDDYGISSGSLPDLGGAWDSKWLSGLASENDR